MNLLYHFDGKESIVSEWDDRQVPVAFCPISQKPCGEIESAHPAQALYHGVIAKYVAAIKGENDCIFAKQSVPRFGYNLGYHNGIMSFRTKYIESEDELDEMLQGLAVPLDKQWCIIHNISLYTNDYGKMKFYMQTDVELIKIKDINITPLVRRFFLDDILEAI